MLKKKKLAKLGYSFTRILRFCICIIDKNTNNIMYVFEFDLSLVSLNNLKLSKSRAILSRLIHNQIKQWFYQLSHHLQHKHTSTVLDREDNR